MGIWDIVEQDYRAKTDQQKQAMQQSLMAMAPPAFGFLNDAIADSLASIRPIVEGIEANRKVIDMKDDLARREEELKRKMAEQEERDFQRELERDKRTGEMEKMRFEALTTPIGENGQTALGSDATIFDINDILMGGDDMPVVTDTTPIDLGDEFRQTFGGASRPTVTADDDFMSGTMQAAPMPFDSIDDLAAMESMSDPFAGQQAQRQMQGGELIDAPIDPMSGQMTEFLPDFMGGGTGGYDNPAMSFQGMSERWDENVAPYLPPVLNTVPGSALDNLAAFEGVVDDFRGVAGPVLSDTGGALAEMGRQGFDDFMGSVTPPAMQSAQQRLGPMQQGPVDPIAPKTDAPPVASASGNGVIAGDVLSPGDGIAQMQEANARTAELFDGTVDLPVSYADSYAGPGSGPGGGGDAFDQLTLNDVFPIGGDREGNVPAGPMSQSDMEFLDLIESRGDSPGGGFQMDDGSIRWVDVSGYQNRLNEIVAKANESDDPIAKNLAAAGIDPESMNVVRPGPDGNPLEVPLADTRNQLSFEQAQALNLYERAQTQRGLDQSKIANEMAAEMAKQAAKGTKPDLQMFGNPQEGKGLGVLDKSTLEYKELIPKDPDAIKAPKDIKKTFGTAAKKGEFKTTPEAENAFTILGVSDMKKIANAIKKDADALLWDATSTRWSSADKASLAALVNQASLSPKYLTDLEEKIKDWDDDDRALAEKTIARVRELIGASTVNAKAEALSDQF